MPWIGSGLWTLQKTSAFVDETTRLWGRSAAETRQPESRDVLGQFRVAVGCKKSSNASSARWNTPAGLCQLVSSSQLITQSHRRNQNFLWGCTFLHQKSYDLFSHHPDVLHAHIRHILPPTTFLSHLRGCTSPNSAPFLPYSNKKCLQKLLLVGLGVHLNPLRPWLRPCSVNN